MTAIKNSASQLDATATNQLTAQITAIQQQIAAILAVIKTSLSSDRI
jgi:hypothetical protein